MDEPKRTLYSTDEISAEDVSRGLRNAKKIKHTGLEK
jgi:hypothetical protein